MGRCKITSCRHVGALQFMKDSVAGDTVLREALLRILSSQNTLETNDWHLWRSVLKDVPGATLSDTCRVLRQLYKDKIIHIQYNKVGASDAMNIKLRRKG